MFTHRVEIDGTWIELLWEGQLRVVTTPEKFRRNEYGFSLAMEILHEYWSGMEKLCRIIDGNEPEDDDLMVAYFIQELGDEPEFLRELARMALAAARKELGPETAIRKKVAGYVYLLGSDSGVFKIGKTVNLDGRLERLETIYPGETPLIHYFETDDTTTAEQLLHQRYADRRQKGEWFALLNPDVAEIQAIGGYFDGEWS